LSRTRIKALVKSGYVKVSERTVLIPREKTLPGQKITVFIPKPEPLNLIPEDIPIDIVFEDEHLIVLNKQAGIVVHPGAGNISGTLVQGLLTRCVSLSGIGGKMRPGIVHRLDKDTSGLMIVAKSDVAHGSLVKKFKNREIHKKYLAIVSGRLDDSAGIIDLPIGRHVHRRTRMAVDFRNGRQAKTIYRVLRNLGAYQLVELEPLTGRTHQIRVHMSYLGHPLIGDKIYGGPGGIRLPSGIHVDIPRHMLHARHLLFGHPVTGKRLCLEASVPEDMNRLIHILSGQGMEMTTEK